MPAFTHQYKRRETLHVSRRLQFFVLWCLSVYGQRKGCRCYRLGRVIAGSGHCDGVGPSGGSRSRSLANMPTRQSGEGRGWRCVPHHRCPCNVGRILLAQ